MKSLKGIESFIEVATTGGFSTAAKQLGVSAVAVSKNVATLERQLGVRLFQRTTRKLNLTAEGHAFSTTLVFGSANCAKVAWWRDLFRYYH
jgi:DNA-binding transcriptional LysR family regulator